MWRVVHNALQPPEGHGGPARFLKTSSAAGHTGHTPAPLRGCKVAGWTWVLNVCVMLHVSRLFAVCDMFSQSTSAVHCFGMYCFASFAWNELMLRRTSSPVSCIYLTEPVPRELIQLSTYSHTTHGPSTACVCLIPSSMRTCRHQQAGRHLEMALREKRHYSHSHAGPSTHTRTH